VHGVRSCLTALFMPLALASEGQGTKDMGFDGFFLSAEFIRRLGGRTYSEPILSRPADLPISRLADKFWLGRSLALP